MDNLTSENESFWSDLLSDVSPQLDFSDVSIPDEPKRDIFATPKRKAWDKSGQQRCDFSQHVALTRHNSYYVISLWRRTIYGRTLRDIKADDNMVTFFADSVARLISDIMGDALERGGWALVTTPKRRHRERNFATRVCLIMAQLLGITFYEDMAQACNTDRVHPIFRLNVLPDEPNLIVFDDIITTGMTLEATKQLLLPHHKNMIFVVGINNHL